MFLFETFLLAIGGASFAAQAIAANRGLRARRRVWRSTHVTTIAEASDGVVAIVGTVRRLPTSPCFPAPLSGRECLAYQVEGTNTTGALANEARCASFLLEDETGRAIVQLEVASQAGPRLVDAELQLTADWRTGTERTGWGAVEEFLTKHRVLIGLSRVEAILAEGATVAVRGRSRRTIEPDPQRVDDYRAAPSRLLLVGDAEVPLWISNDPALVRR